jgi:HPt (histidine-containing phosphotransfer) domain-containing protein
MENTVQVDEMFRDLIPFFLENRRNELAEMENALTEKNFSALAKLGHKLYGCVTTYGFNSLGKLAKDLEAGALSADEQYVKKAVGDIRHYLKDVQVTFVNSTY